MQLSKAYDCLPHHLLAAKLIAHRLDVRSLCLMYSYLDSNHRRVKIGPDRSTTKIKMFVPQGSVLGPLLSLVSAPALSTQTLRDAVWQMTTPHVDMIYKK